MTKASLLLLVAIFVCQFSYSQFSFTNDNSDMRVQSGVFEKIEKKYHLEKDYDFELRLWIFPKVSDTSTNLTLFILSNKKGKWNARLFQNVWLEDKMKEISLKQDGLDTLWKRLSDNDVLTLPQAWTLLDKNGNNIVRQREDVSYSFELLSKHTYRSYAYECPKEFSTKYDYVSAYKKVALIVKYISDFLGLDIIETCATNGVQQKVFCYAG